MGDCNKTNEELINELLELQQAYNSLKATNETDMLSRKRTEEELRASEERFQLLFNKAPLGYQSLDFDGNFIEVNQQWLSTLGYEREEVIGKWFGDFLTPAFKDGFCLRFPIFKAQGKIHSEFEMVHKNGSVLFISFDGRIGYDLNGEFKQTHCILQDITQRKQAEEKLRESVEEYRNLIEFSPIAMSIIHNWKTIYFNPAAVHLFGAKTQDELLGKHIFEFIHPYFHELATENAKLLDEKGHVGIQEQKYLKLDGTVLDVESQAKTIRFNDDAATLVVINDITERKQAEEALRKSEAIKNKIVSNIGDVIVIIDQNGITQYKSPSITALFGWKPEELVGKSTWDNVHPDDLDAAQKFFVNLITEPEATGTTELRYKRNDGNYVWIQIKVVNLLHDKDIQGILGNYHDISERKKAEQELISAKEKAEQSETFLTAIIENQPGLIWLKDVNGKFQKANTKFLNSCGLSTPEQLYLKTDFDIWPKNLANKYTTDDIQVIDSKKSLIVEEPIIDNGINKWFETFKTPVVDDKGKVIGTTGFSFEITERKKAELEIIAAKEKAEESDRLKSAFLANMSHEIRTPLNSIIGFSDLLVDPDFEVEQKMEFVNMMRSSSNNLLAIINDIIDISKIETGQVTINKKQFLLEELIKEIVEENSLKAIEKGIDLRIRFADQGTSIALENDPARLKQILTNFVNNAIKFTEKGYVEIGFAETNGLVQIQVKDTGIGIPPQYHEQIFERFIQLEDSQTRKHGGNGLGLCISKQLAHLLDCKIWLESESGKGSIFYLSAPKFIE